MEPSTFTSIWIRSTAAAARARRARSSSYRAAVLRTESGVVAVSWLLALDPRHAELVEQDLEGLACVGRDPLPFEVEARVEPAVARLDLDVIARAEPPAPSPRLALEVERGRSPEGERDAGLDQRTLGHLDRERPSFGGPDARGDLRNVVSRRGEPATHGTDPGPREEVTHEDRAQREGHGPEPGAVARGQHQERRQDHRQHEREVAAPEEPIRRSHLPRTRSHLLI